MRSTSGPLSRRFARRSKSNIELRSAHCRSSTTNNSGRSREARPHEVGDRVEQKSSARLRINCVRKRERTDAVREARRNAGNLAAVTSDMFSQDRHRRARA